ncbi:MAG: sugar ABC transporter permease [Gemmatimonadetes bacterium]|nr:sugar ABC transporter permease [Gemmatimonadota bacterium]MBT5327296.1 sugar ABC transporter permease [Gemmatimonadota bacterium]MBT5449144.1 sugar ABC transporter permease [Gemmatimonadota bacterium]MBT5801195.1 sugar ABC transporter permease [Gemmatimonadota bacterium]MBT6619164.1 sugar ABC transporter permease [Gemmatimonadota bacterium]
MLGLVIAFKDFRLVDGVMGSAWSGLDNFRRLFGGADFPLALRNTVTISLLRLCFGFFAPIALALMLNEVRLSWYKRTIQTVTYIPYFLSWVILGGIFLIMFAQNGPVNQMAMMVGIEPIEFLTNDFWFIVVIIATGIWQAAGYGAVIYLAALSGISPDLYEAAVVDGAGRWKQTWHITIPGLIPTIVTLFILNLGHVLNAGFDQIYNMYNPMVFDAADIIDTYVLRRIVLMDFGLATGAGLFKSVVGLMMVVLANSLARRVSGGEQGIW